MNKEEEEMIKEQERNKEEMEEIMREIELFRWVIKNHGMNN